eukprot:2763129-Ditylum_brightwellii.AAC.1
MKIRQSRKKALNITSNEDLTLSNGNDFIANKNTFDSNDADKLVRDLYPEMYASPNNSEEKHETEGGRRNKSIIFKGKKVAYDDAKKLVDDIYPNVFASPLHLEEKHEAEGGI